MTRAIRRALVGGGQPFEFRATRTVRLVPPKSVALYVHIPFCRTLCPYCPYDRIRYDRTQASAYALALASEIEQYRSLIGGRPCTSLYLGGGTPTTMLAELGPILDQLREAFPLEGPLCVETKPHDLEATTARRLKEMGVTLLSVGVQSFDSRHLRSLGRAYDPSEAERAVEAARTAGFDSVNVDLMFVLPGQTTEDFLGDLRKAVALGADQITIYPLFTFPHSTAGARLALRAVRMPAFATRRAMFGAAHRFLQDGGYRRVSVWGFVRGEGPRYSSVTRDAYLGLGAGACTKTDGLVYFNTFSVPEYTRVALSGSLPVAFSMPVTRALERFYWLYWRLYDAGMDEEELTTRFLGVGRSVRAVVGLAGLLGMCRESEEHLELTERGCFYVHLLQNYFFLSYVDKVWSAAMREPWPQSIVI